MAVFNCISSMTCVEHLFICFFAIRISLVKCLFRSFSPFKICYLFSHCFKSSLYILDNCPLSAMSFVNIFFQSEAYPPWCIFSNSLWTGNILGIVYAAAAAAKLLQSCQTLCDPIDGSLPGSPIPGILKTRTLEWVAISFSRKMTLLFKNT